MTKKTTFDYDDYRACLADGLAAEREKRRGAQARLAEAMGCQSAYLSMVLHGRAELSLEQATDATAFFRHSEQEAHFFLLLVQRARAGSPALRRYFDVQIAQVLDERTVLARRLSGTTTISAEHMTVYYGAWYFRAIHIALTVPALQSRDALQDYMGLPVDVLNRALEFLVACGLAKREGETYLVGPSRLHLDQISPHAMAAHSQHRLRTLTALAMPRSDDFHYSSMVSASARDLPKLKEIMMRAIEEMRAVIRDSPEEDVFAYGFDLFKLKG